MKLFNIHCFSAAESISPASVVMQGLSVIMPLLNENLLSVSYKYYPCFVHL